MQNLRYYVPGIVLILMAIMIVAVPEVLVAFVAAFVMMAGIGALYLGHMIRRSEIGLRKTDGWFFNNDPYDWRCVKESIFRKWH